MATYWERGESIDYTNTGDTPIEQGTVISLGTRIGVAGCNILPGKVGSLHVTGVFIVPKAAGAVIDQGDAVYFSATDNNITATDTDVPAGWAIQAAAADAPDVYVKIG